MAPHIEPSCASGDHSCMEAGTFIGVIFTATVISVAAFVLVTLWRKRHQKQRAAMDRDIGNEQAWFVSNYGVYQMQNLPPHQNGNPSNAPQEAKREPKKSASDLWRQRGFEMPGAATKAGVSGPPVPPTIPEEADIGMQSAEHTPVQRSVGKVSSTPIADTYMSPGARFAAPRPLTSRPLYSVPMPSPYIDQRKPPAPRSSVKSPSGTPIADAYTSPRLSFAASRASSYSKQGRPPMPSLSVDTQRARQPTMDYAVGGDMGTRPPNPRQTSSDQGRKSKFQEQLDSPTAPAGGVAAPETFEEIKLSPPPRKSTQSALGSPSRRSFSSIFSGKLPTSWGRPVKGRVAE